MNEARLVFNHSELFYCCFRNNLTLIPTFQDGTEYDEYGNRKREQYGLGVTRPRGYDRSDRYPQESEPRPVYNYQKPSRTVDNDLKAVSTNKTIICVHNKPFF